MDKPHDCKDCKHYSFSTNRAHYEMCGKFDIPAWYAHREDHFCKRGEKKEHANAA